jgi:hypothetical protein
MFPCNGQQPPFPSPTIGEFNSTTTAPLTPESGFYEEQHGMQQQGGPFALMPHGMHHPNAMGMVSGTVVSHQGTSPVSFY